MSEEKESLRYQMNTVFLSIMVLTSLAGAIVFGFSPNSSIPQDNSFIVMTYNTHFGVGIDGNYNPERIARTVAQARVDIVGFQEITRATALNGFADLASDLSREMRQQGYEYSYIGDEGRQALHNAIFSRYPIIKAETIPIQPRVTYQRTVIIAVIDVEGINVTVAVTHVTHVIEDRSNPDRVEQIKYVLSLLASIRGPLILLGDFNSEPNWKEIYTIQLAGYYDAFAKANGVGAPGYTYSSENPFQRIDYIFLKNGVSVLDSFVVDSRASDHFPVVAIVDI